MGYLWNRDWLVAGLPSSATSLCGSNSVMQRWSWCSGCVCTRGSVRLWSACRPDLHAVFADDEHGVALVGVSS
jgi:hypothetical protein